MTNRRNICSECLFPATVCLCDDITPINNNTQIIILQEPSEAKAAKNTARLLALSLSNLQLVQGISEADFASVRRAITPQTALLYPDENAAEIGRYDGKIDQLIIIDATWRKAYKLLKLNPWLNELPKVTLASHYHSSYQRKAKSSNHLSTLEACAFALGELESLDYGGLLRLQQARQSSITINSTS